MSDFIVLTNNQDVVKLLHAIDFRQQLVDHRVVYTRAAGARASLLADSIQLIEDDDVQAAVGAKLKTVFKKSFILKCFCICTL